ncbi:hypothetical protein LXL04_009004 [Taraxacum kok-saghyz]
MHKVNIGKWIPIQASLKATTLTDSIQASLKAQDSDSSFTQVCPIRFKLHSRRRIQIRSLISVRIQLQHKFWQPNVQHDSITAQFNYNGIQLQQNSITFLSITTNQTGPECFVYTF